MIKQRVLLWRAGKLIVVLALICSGLFYFINSYAASKGSVVINEVAWMGTEVSVNDEWIELRNITDSEINLEGWTIIAQDGSPSIELSGSIAHNGYYLLERSSDDSLPGIAADLIYTGALGNSGEGLELRDSEDNLIDSIEASEGWLAGDNADKLTMERTNNGSWQSSQSTGGTPKAVNSAGSQVSPEPGEKEQPEPEILKEDVVSIPEAEEVEPLATYSLGDIVINEFVSDPADGEVEWVELYNTTSKNIDLADWTVEEGSGAKTTLEGEIGPSNEDRFMVIEKPKGNLNNKGDIIILRDSKSTLIDQVVYGDWDDGNKDNNAPQANDPNSIARKLDGYNSYNNANDFVITVTPTKGKSNIITAEEETVEEEISAEEKAQYDYSSDINVTEIFPNPVGSDTDDEFIELYNKGERDVNLTGWKLGDESKKRFIFKEVSSCSSGFYRSAKTSSASLRNDSCIIKTGDYLVIYRSESKIALNNGNDSVKLFQPLMDNPLQEVKYEKAIEGWSYNLEEQACPLTNSGHCQWQWSEIVTPGAENEIKSINHPPTVDFGCLEEILVKTPTIFDSSDTVDEDEDELIFFWDFGDGATNTLPIAEHTFLAVGAFTVKLIVSDGKNKAEKEKIVKVVNTLAPLPSRLAGSPSQEGSSTLSLFPTGKAGKQEGIVINEILPNPEGADTDGEWIEILNRGEVKIDLSNWQLDDSEGGSKPYSFLDNFLLEAGKFLVVDRAESGLALNNTPDAVRLFNNLGELVDEVEYEKAIEGEAYARGLNDKWFWTTALTPGQENIISVADSESVIVAPDSYSYTSSANSVKSNGDIIIETTLENIKECEVGDLVKVNGTVAVLPGVLGSQYFYITGSPGIQVYNYYKDFPSLQLGDYITVSGEISMSNGEMRIKTKQASDMQVLEHGEPPAPEQLSCDKISEEYTGQLVSVTGEVVERKSSLVYLDDGTDETLIYIKAATGINASNIKEGERVAVTGLVGRTQSGPRIMPRSNEDIIKKDIESTAVDQVLGEIAVSDQWAIAQRDKKLELFKYLLVIAGAVIVVLSGLLVKVSQRG